MNLVTAVCCTLLAGCSSALLSSGSTGSTSPASASTKTANASALKRVLDTRAPAWLEQFDVPSLSVAYVQNGQLAWTAAYGRQSAGVPASENTLYNLASLTKPISAEVILRLVSKEKFSLDQSLADGWVDPDIKNNPWSTLLTARFALSHQTGFANWRRMTGGVLTFKFEPGTQTAYSGEGYEYVARFAQERMHLSFDELARQTVFDPIGMKATSYTRRDGYAGRVASPHGAKGEMRDPQFATEWNAADLVYSTTTDYAKFLMSVMRNEQVTKQVAAQRQTITRDTLSDDQRRTLCALAAQDSAACPVQSGFGLGWAVFRDSTDTILWHNGSDWGIRTFAMYSPQRQTGIVIFSNGENGKALIREALKVLYPDRVFIASLGD